MGMMKKAMAMKMSMKSMKVMKAMAMKMSMKKKVYSKKYIKTAVWKGLAVKTFGGLKKTSLMKSKSGKIVSSKKSAFGKKMYSKYLSKWTSAVQKARKALGVKGFVAVKKGSALYKKAKSFYK